jgi:pantetheine-phosphate adenylyltransferase
VEAALAQERIGIYPGTFDPITFGHMDIIRRAAKLVDRLVVGVARHSSKTPIFSVEERCRLIENEVGGLEGGTVVVTGFDGLMVEFAESVHAGVIFRGLRAVSDFDYEFQMVGMNARLKPHIQTVFLMAEPEHHFISASLVRQIGSLGGDVRSFVPAGVAKALAGRLANTDD